MHHVEDFMREYFSARIAEEQRHQTSRLPFRNKFYADDCRYDSRADTLMRMESEKIVSIDDGKSDSMVITEQTRCNSGGIKKMSFRYHLQTVNEGWVIRAVDIACVVCGGRGDNSCPYCKGKRWVNAGRKWVNPE